MKPEKIYQSVRDSRDPEAALKALKPKRWLKLYGHLLRTFDENSNSGVIFGMMMVIAADRYAECLAKREKAKEVMG